MSERSRIPSSPVPDVSLQDARALAGELRVEPEVGLSPQEAAHRLRRDGANTLRTTPTRPLWRRLVAPFQDPLVYLLLVAVVVALSAWIIEGSEGWPIDAIVITIIVLLNAALGVVEEARAEQAVAALSRMTEVSSTVLREGHEERVPSKALVRGDILLLAEGDTVGADARLLRSSTLRVQEASLTGESEAVLKDATTLTASAPLAERLNMVYKGTAVVEGTARAVVTATGMRTEMGAIAAMLEATADELTPLQKEVARIGRMLGIAVVVIALVVVATIVALSDIRTASDLITVLLLGVSLAVAAVPEGLPAILSVVLALGVQRMASRQAIVKQLSSVETLGSATVICSDKTGTLTRSEMTVGRVVTASGHSEVSGVGYAPEGEVRLDQAPLTQGPAHAEHIVMLSGGSLASNAGLRQGAQGEWEILGDPTEAAFLVAERKLGVHQRREQRFERLDEIPFTSSRKMMSIIARDKERDDELVLISKGAPDVLMQRCTHIRVGMEVLPFNAAERARALADVDALSDAAYRTLSVAYRPLAAGEHVGAHDALEQALIFVGTVGIIDPPREEAAVAIAQARRAGIRVIMITGDHPRTAARIAADLGLVEPGAPAVTGAELDALDEAAFLATVRHVSVYARVAPAHKMRIVDALQREGHVVAMTGDGVNDAPAIKSADIGVAMGLTGTEVTKEAAKMILADDNFATIVDAVREGRTIFDNIRKFLRYLLSSNMGEVLTVFLGVVGAGVIGLSAGAAGHGAALVLPLLATQILWINLVTDSGPALAMGIDPRTEDVMARPPRRLDEGAFGARMWWGVLWSGLVMALATLFTIDLYLPGGLVEGPESLDVSRTAGFTVLVIAQLFNCFNSRSDTTSAFVHLFSNRWLWAAIALSALLQVAVVQLEILNVAFGTAPLSLAQWAVCVLMGSLVLWLGEARKVVLRALDAHAISRSISRSISRPAPRQDA